MAKAIKVDPQAKTIEQIEIASTDEISAVLGGYFNIEKIGKPGEFVYFDDMGHTKDDLGEFTIGRVVIRGPALVLCNGLRDARSSVDDVVKMVRFAEREAA